MILDYFKLNLNVWPRARLKKKLPVDTLQIKPFHLLANFQHPNYNTSRPFPSNLNGFSVRQMMHIGLMTFLSRLASTTQYPQPKLPPPPLLPLQLPTPPPPLPPLSSFSAKKVVLRTIAFQIPKVANHKYES